MGVVEGAISLVQAIPGRLSPSEVRYVGYKMGTKSVVGIVN